MDNPTVKIATHDEKAVCKYCNKSFRRQTSLIVHNCETGRRWKQEKETGVRLGFAAFLQFYTATQGSAVTKTYASFVDSPYYSAFVKFGQYMVQIKVIDATKFTRYLLDNKYKLDSWTKDSYYDDYLYEYLRKEHPTAALDRTFSEMQGWADEVGKPFNTIFREAAPLKLCNMIINGRISPWIIYNSNDGIEFLSKLSDDQISIIFKFIDPEYWQRRLTDYLADSEYLKSVLTEVGM